MLRLISIQGTMLGQVVPLANSETTIGRDPGNTLAFPSDNALSRHHLRILRVNDSYTVEDLGSTNGSYLNGMRLAAPSSLNHNDEIRIGGQVFRAEAEFARPTTPPRQEVSGGEGPGLAMPRGAEYPKGGLDDILSDMRGCAMPKFDADGCLKYLWYFLLALLVAALIAGVIYLVGMGIGALGGSGAGVPVSSGGGSAPGGGGGSAGDQEQPPQDNQAQSGIEILEIKIDYARRDGKNLQPVVLLKWRNTGFDSVTRLEGKLRVYDKSNHLLLTKEKQILYQGTGVDLGEIHEDKLPQEGLPVPDRLSQTPGSARVEIEKVQ